MPKYYKQKWHFNSIWTVKPRKFAKTKQKSLDDKYVFRSAFLIKS